MTEIVFILIPKPETIKSYCETTFSEKSRLVMILQDSAIESQDHACTVLPFIELFAKNICIPEMIPFF